MDDTSAPAGLAACLRAEGLRLAGPVGAGAGGPRWSAVGHDGRRWVVAVVAPGRAEAARERADALAGAAHPALAEPGPVLPLPGGGAVVLQAVAPGTDLSVLGEARGRLRPGEVVALLVPVADGLAALHAAGLTHGDVSPANVVLTPDGPVLVDLVEGAGSAERGTPGFAAPERARGASAAGDVHALARVGLVLLGEGADDDATTRRLRACLREAAAADPAARPAARDVALTLPVVAAPEEPVLPDPAVLARLALRRLADGTASTGRSRRATGRHPGAAGRADGTSPPGRSARRASRSASARRVPPRPVRGRRARGGRHTGGRRGTRLAGPLMILSAVVTAAAVAGTWLLSGPGPRPEGRPAADAHPGPVDAAGLLTVERAAALRTGDRARLAAVTVPASPAAVADGTVLGRVRSTGGEVPRPAVDLAGRPETGPGEARVPVRVRSGSAPTTVVLVLRPTAAGWRVCEVLAPG